ALAEVHPRGQSEADDECCGNRSAGSQECFVATSKLSETVAGRRRAGLHRLVVQITLDLAAQGSGRLVTPVAVLFQAFHHDPVEFASDVFAQSGRLSVTTGGNRRQRVAGAELGAGLLRLFFADDSQHFVEGRLVEPYPLKRRRASEQLIEQDTKR